MQRTRIKFCGLTQVDDIKHAVELGVDSIGVVFVPQSPRFVDPDIAYQLREAIPPFVSAVALFMDAEAHWIQDVLEVFSPDILQFHGQEDPDFCAFFGDGYIKAIAMGTNNTDTDQQTPWEDYQQAGALLFDAHAPGEQGGKGEVFDWQQLQQLRIEQPVVLAGGLNPDNVNNAIKTVQPYAVDVSSGIESRPGIKDIKKMKQFIRQVQLADVERMRE